MCLTTTFFTLCLTTTPLHCNKITVIHIFFGLIALFKSMWSTFLSLETWRRLTVYYTIPWEELSVKSVHSDLNFLTRVSTHRCSTYKTGLLSNVTPSSFWWESPLVFSMVSRIASMSSPATSSFEAQIVTQTTKIMYLGNRDHFCKTTRALGTECSPEDLQMGLSSFSFSSFSFLPPQYYSYRESKRR